MSKLTQECDIVIDSLHRFSEDMITLGKAINDNRVEVFEQEIKFVLPFDFKYIIKKINGFALMGIEVLGIENALRGNSLDEVYRFEHYKVANAMPNGFMPFSPDGFGNHYCLNLEKVINGVCPIMFWQHDFNYQAISDVEKTHDSFKDWVNEVMISWTLEDHNYDGTEK